MLLQRNVLVEVPSVANATPNSLSFPATKREELILTKEKSSRQILLEKRKNVLKEILVTERNYVCDLSVLVCLFLKPLQVETVLPKDDIELIFLNIEVIYKLSHEFLMQLETVFKDPESIDPELSLGTILIQIGHFLKIYSAYCANCKTGMEHNAVCVKTNPDYAQYLKDTQSSTECKGLSLNDYLIKPVQRICKYPLLFEELAKSTPIDHPDYNAVLSTQSLFQTVAEMTNRNSADKENMEKLVNFVAVVDGFHDANHFKCGRQVLLDEWLQVITPKTSTPGSFHIYLFSDQLVITKRVRRKSTNASRVRTKEQKSERLKHQLNLKSYYLGETVEDNKNGFTLTATNNENIAPEGDVTFTFICPTPGSKTKWMDDLKRLVGETPSPELGRPTFARKRSQRKLGKPELLRSKSKELLNNRSVITSPPEIKEDKIDKEKSDLASRKTLSRSLTTNLEPSKPNRLQRKVSISNVLGKHVDKPEKAGEKAEKLVEKVETPEILTKLSDERKKMSKTNRDRKSKEIEKFRKTLTAKSDGAIDDKISHPSDQECLDEINSLISSIDTTDPKLTETKSYKDKPSLRLKRSESKFTSLRAGYDSVRDKRSDDEKLRKSKSLLRLDVFSQGDDKKTHSQASLPELEEEKPKKKEKSRKNSISFSRRSSILLPELPADDESATPRTWRDPKAELNTLNEATEVSTVERSEEKDSDEIDEKNPKNKFCLSSNISEEVNGAESDNEEDFDHSIVDNPVVPAKDLKTSAPEKLDRNNRYSVYQFAPASLIQQDFSQMGHMIQMPQIPQVPLPGMMPHLPNQIQNNQMSKMHPYLQATPFSYLQPSLGPMAINNDMYHHLSAVPPAYYPSHPYLGSVYIPPTQICARCNTLISEGSASIFFHNRNYHANCYLCSHCNVSLIENKPHEHNKGLYCEECHHALNMDFSPVSNKQRTVLKHHQDNL